MRFFCDVLGLDVWVQGEEQAILKTPTGQQLETSAAAIGRKS